MGKSGGSGERLIESGSCGYISVDMEK